MAWEVWTVLKLIKYEYRKDIVLYLILFFGIFALQIYMMTTALFKAQTLFLVGYVLAVLAMFIAILFIFIFGAISYYREINSKFSYMTFMTPSSPSQILGAKYISLFLATLLAGTLATIFVIIDFKLAINSFPDIADFVDTFQSVVQFTGNMITDILIAIGVTGIIQCLNFLATMSCVYFAITLSVTLLANKSGKGIVSFLFIVVFCVALNIIGALLPNFDFGDSFIQLMLGSWPIYVFQLIVIVGSFFGITSLLKHKLSL